VVQQHKKIWLVCIVNETVFLPVFHAYHSTAILLTYILLLISVLSTYGPKLNQILQDRSAGLVDRVKKDGEEFIQNFLDCNDDAKKTESGLVYCSMKEGTGKTPSASSTVEVHYHGTLTDGTVFDSSVERGQTISFPLGGVIKGWQEGLKLMKEGGKATLVIPSDLAYGDSGSGDVIPPGATLKFEVELFKVS